MKDITKSKHLALTLILCGALYATNHIEEVQQTKKPPVDEGFNIKPKEDKVKDITFVNDEISEETITLSLEKQEEKIIIKFEKSTKVPLICKVIREEKEILSIMKEPINPKESTALSFTLEKSELQIDDEIIITNRRNIKIKRIKLLK